MGGQQNFCDRGASKYWRWYMQIVERARLRPREDGMERHHIRPKSLGGSNDPANLVPLTYREHFLAHWLLVKVTTGADKKKMSFALWSMTRTPDGARRPFSSWQYATARKAQLEAVAGRVVSQETRARIVIAKSYTSEETRKRISDGQKKTMTADRRAAMGARNRARVVTPEARANMSAAQSKRSHRPEHSEKLRGHIVSDETRQKMSQMRTAYWANRRAEAPK